ncbi:MAG: hypothetical protein ACRC6I_03125, partial [Paracoccaceae bacterium]
MRFLSPMPSLGGSKERKLQMQNDPTTLDFTKTSIDEFLAQAVEDLFADISFGGGAGNDGDEADEGDERPADQGSEGNEDNEGNEGNEDDP